MSKIKTAKNVCNTTNEELMAAIRCDINTVVSAMGMLSIEVTEMNRRLGKAETVKKPVESENKKAEKAKTAAKKDAPKKKAETPAPDARQNPRGAFEFTVNVGSQPVRELAENDAKDFLNNPRVWLYRPTQFPDPRRSGVQPCIMAASVVERKDPKFSRAPWTTRLTISVTGDPKRVSSWSQGVLNKNKADQV